MVLKYCYNLIIRIPLDTSVVVKKHFNYDINNYH